ncbi:MAG: amylo-alpha-1,6-glucosidase [Bacteroidota bacterium]
MLKTNYGTDTTHRFNRAIQHEWLETNGIGGYASSTIIGAHTRRYHGLLVAALQPPVERAVLLSKLDETLIINGHPNHLGANKYRGTVYPSGYIFQQAFTHELFPTFTYQVQDVVLEKQIVGLHGENTTLIRYEVKRSSQPFQMDLLPQLAGRNFHHLQRARHLPPGQVHFQTGQLKVDLPELQSQVYVQAEGLRFRPAFDWYFQLEFPMEEYRGLEAHEDLYSPGHLSANLKEGDQWVVIVSENDAEGRDGIELYEKEKLRRLRLIRDSKLKEPILQKLCLAADQFIVRRDSDRKSIIAGYHWFSDWGRDTMIALPGLCLATGRQAEAKRILQTFCQYLDQGMIPNRFPDQGEKPVYNTIDATLWMFVALYKYLRQSDNPSMEVLEFLPFMGDILHWHQKGTRYNIHMADDGLLTGGIGGVQLTWMDAKVDDWVVTPRIGKCVEINALWYNAWQIYAQSLRWAGKKTEASKAEAQAEIIAHQFNRLFWNEEKGCLYDLVDHLGPDASVRPNQLFAISLPFPLLDHRKAEAVLNVVDQELFTPVGMRSLSPQNPQFRPIYGGDQYQRDGAYHQGTVWGWLMGPYLDALIYVKGRLGKLQARRIILALEEHLQTDGVGSLSEIFDGKSPNQARGCIAQAWSVSEVLRVATEYSLFPGTEKEKGLLAFLPREITTNLFF